MSTKPGAAEDLLPIGGWNESVVLPLLLGLTGQPIRADELLVCSAGADSEADLGLSAPEPLVLLLLDTSDRRLDRGTGKL